MTRSEPAFSAPQRLASGPVPRGLSKALQAAAAGEARGEVPIARSIDMLRNAALLADDGTADPARTARALMQIGAANLGVGRLYEGHINALHLMRLYGTAAQTRMVEDCISGGAVLGVWGADGKTPLTEAGGRLQGGKCFASGLGTVTQALVTVNSGPDARLALVDVTDPKQADHMTWAMHGMQATASGSYDFTDLPTDRIAWVGAPGDYQREPHFVGGVWRIAALQAGAAVGLLDQAASELRAIERMQAEAQKARLMSALMRGWAGIALTERAAQAVIDPDLLPEDIVAASITARLFTEEVALDAIRAVEQSIGLRHFEVASETGRMARDLSVYLRQAARDAFMQRAAQTALGAPGGVWGVFA
ncbi:acyl-CoA dehydrogenase [Rhodobacteraceae bacterium KMM 6894]|nr:acyl-CoA dehydrogenase [Rhodobacteraceae bacterium KMM 6894]